jgi:uncharacterized protein (TIGR00251 family)
MVEREQIRIVTRVQPNASRNQALGFKNGVLHIRIAAPPTKGKANHELIKFLSDILGVNKSNLIIEKGMTSQTKTIAIKGLQQKQAMRQLGKY